MLRKKLLLCIALCFLTVAVAATLPNGATTAQDRSTQDDTMITMDFQEVELPVLVKFISELTGKNFILDDKVKGKKITIISPTKISKSEAYRVFESILDIKELTTVPSGSIIKIIPTKDAASQSLKTIVGNEWTPVSDGMITRLIPLEFVDSEEMIKILKPLTSRESKIDAYTPTNTLIITDTASNISRLMRILSQLDVEADQMVMAVIPLEYASAEVLAGQLQEILQTMNTPAASGTTKTPRRTSSRRSTSRAQTSSPHSDDFSGKIIADDRTNSLIVLSTAAQLKKIRELVQKLDYDTPRAYGNINVYYLEYANAEDTAKVLSDLVSNAGSASKSNQPKAAPAALRTMESFEGEVSITADVPTNSLIIVASPRDYQTLRNVIEKIDIRRKQVYIEAVIMEVQPTFLQDLGFEFRGGIPLQSGDDVDQVLFGGSNFSGSTDSMISGIAGLASGSISTDTALYPYQMGSDSGLTLGAIFDTITIPLGNGQSINLPAEMFLIHALHRSTKTNIISTPHLIAMDNEEAEIVVGQNVPFITSTSQTTVSTVTQVQRENVGVTLRFTPQITEGDYIQLELYQEISALTESPIDQDVNTVGPTTLTRKATNVVLVRDMQTIVVGGLMEDRVVTEKNKVPWLGDIPFLGWFFRWDTDSVTKNNLLIFLTPTILREDQDVQKLFEQKKRRMLQYKKKHKISDKYLDTAPLERVQPSLNLGEPPPEHPSPAPPVAPAPAGAGMFPASETPPGAAQIQPSGSASATPPLPQDMPPLSPVSNGMVATQPIPETAAVITTPEAASLPASSSSVIAEETARIQTSPSSGQTTSATEQEITELPPYSVTINGAKILDATEE